MLKLDVTALLKLNKLTLTQSNLDTYVGKYAEYAGYAEYAEYAEYAKYADYAEYAKYAEYLPIVFLVERPKIYDL